MPSSDSSEIPENGGLVIPYICIAFEIVFLWILRDVASLRMLMFRPARNTSCRKSSDIIFCGLPRPAAFFVVITFILVILFFSLYEIKWMMFQLS